MQRLARTALVCVLGLALGSQHGAAQPPRVIACSVAQPSDYYTVTPCRVFDSRTVGGALTAGETRSLTIVGLCGVPVDAISVAVNVTAVDPTAAGEFIAWPAGESQPNTSAISYLAAVTRANNGVLKLGAGGALAFRCNQPSGTVHLVLDVFGYFR